MIKYKEPDGREIVLDKEIHFYTSTTKFIPEERIASEYIALATSWDYTDYLISKNTPIIHTLQMGMMSFDLCRKGYNIFIHDDIGVYELYPYCDCKRTDKELRPAHNIFKMWNSGAFDQSLIREGKNDSAK